MAGKVVHFEVPYDDVDRATSFYKDIFGWQIQSVPGAQLPPGLDRPVGRAGTDRARVHRGRHVRPPGRRRDAGDHHRRR